MLIRDAENIDLSMVLAHFRDLLLVKTAPGQHDLLDVTDEEAERLTTQAAKFSAPELGRVLALLIDAQTAMRWTTSPRLSPELALHITSQIAAALGRAHAAGIVHRDLKPENVMLVERHGDKNFVKVLDFGVAKVPVGELSRRDSEAEARAPLTQLGMVYGTPEYMAPEQALGQEVDARADFYALGVIAFEMLTGVRPFEAASKVQLLGMKVTTDSARVRHSRKLVMEFLGSSVDTELASDDWHRWQRAYEADPARFGAAMEPMAAGERDARMPGHHHDPGQLQLSDPHRDHRFQHPVRNRHRDYGGDRTGVLRGCRGGLHRPEVRGGRVGSAPGAGDR